jgi:hypothetical protein
MAPVVVVELDGTGCQAPAIDEFVASDAIVVGVSHATPSVAPEPFDLLLTDAPDVPAPWVACRSIDDSLRELEAALAASPTAATTLTQVLRATEVLPVPVALAVESMAYSMLQHGETFRAWSRRRPAPVPRTEDRAPVVLERRGEELDIVLDRPHLHNAFNAAMRDALCEAFALVACDDTITHVHLRGNGPSFCSGGDLDEFGLARDAAEAHRIRMARSVGRAIDAHASRVTAHLHGACIGAGIELSAFAGRVVATPDTQIRLPEVAMGLVPGAGGTASLPRRIGRHRTAYLALLGGVLDAQTARRWGLVDALAG